ncbi:hydrolase 1, exosortase A system-associated [Undibacterium sp.]|jgi:exosortase A-associated hydrolase 1|uniref:hydrolase 1, exosortase A system-associated n=1 Tax=Undibacterium sp. TaxID=1914977 RepID=UPI002C44390F|nr:hydrolase 1, exosortase A system-associated [Undibacterium sp.]HTD04497.1 hydrolase 1, exosortase A system-associated [Undibacterium sp.]
MNFTETALSFDCHGNQLVGILSLPEQAGPTGVLVLVGGPQYRAGSHRQFTLMTRYLAERGIPAMRFDYRGMGDSEGPQTAFEETGEDVRAALDQFFAAVPGLREVALWGLCDAASASLFYAHQDARVTGLVLLNPWVRTEQGMAKAYLKHYYINRLFDAALWQKIFSGKFSFSSAAKSFAGLVGTAAVPHQAAGAADIAPASAAHNGPPVADLPRRMLDSLARFQGRVLIILANKDLTAQEFADLGNSSGAWKKLLASPRISRRELADADHTFSRRAWRDQVAEWTTEWIRNGGGK